MVVRTRIALALISVAVIGLEITLMRVLALRFWYYFAAMVISVALLGFGSSGTVLTLFQTYLRRRRPFWLSLFGFAAALAVLACAWAVQVIPLDVHYLAWNLRAEMRHILQIECLMMVPFLLTGAFLGLALMDRPERIHGHYGANLFGSGAGAVLSVALLFDFTTADLLILWALLCYVAGLCLTDWRRAGAATGAMAVGAVLLALVWMFPSAVQISPYKKLALEQSKPNTQVVYSDEGPLGRIDVVKGPAIHDAPPGMSLQNPYPIPERSLLIVDGDQTHILYRLKGSAGGRFLDYTTTALPFALGRHATALIIGPGGGAPLALAHQHQSEAIIALEPNRTLVELLQKRFAEEGGEIYQIPGVEVHFEQARSHLRRTASNYDLILVPLLDPAGAAGAGLHAAQENYLFTLESFRNCLRHLKKFGMIGVTVHSKTPPRDGLRLFNLALEALERENRAAWKHLALIRSWQTVTLLVTETPLSAAQLQRIRQFSRTRGFDLCYLPNLALKEGNRHHVLPEPYYVQGTRALLSEERDAYVRNYLFDLGVPTDNRPYFDNFMRWDRLQDLKRQLKGRMPAFLELGSLLLATALLQVTVLAALLIFLPLFPKSAGLKNVPQKGRILLYFLLLGMGFMLLEMSFLQKMILYLGHPIYSAAAVIASFLIFGGLGSQVSEIWARRPTTGILGAGLLTASLAGVYLFLLDPWLGWTQSRGLATRFFIVSVSIAPLAFAMGHMFPIALRRVGEACPPMVPWSWASNGFASVLATAGAPLAAMSFGFSRLILFAVLCYLAAAVIFVFLWRGAPAVAGE